jgi:hypothetical protein
MIDPGHLAVLREIHARLDDSSVNWVITASLNLALQGVPVEVHDIDLQTDEAGAYEIERRFADFVTRKVRFSEAKAIRSHFGELMIDGIKVEIMGAVQIRREDGSWAQAPDLDQHKQVVEVAGIPIPVLSLEYELTGYQKLGRVEKVDLLRSWLSTEHGKE